MRKVQGRRGRAGGSSPGREIGCVTARPRKGARVVGSSEGPESGPFLYVLLDRAPWVDADWPTFEWAFRSGRVLNVEVPIIVPLP